ncbi:uncharacterized protein LOC113872267 [Abrus precatorius]|uniref:Uncharacterized protein LOC113872267 n=1 Tax=Abrus precatorius TaxID=3816 RepID=A0A8B8MAC2_ABRPR|nr:uncharacterized protein LOC113872267 [Abrus precatorius]
MQMQTLGRFCLLVAAAHSVLGFYHRFLRLSLRFFFMDFPSTFKFLTQASEVGCGFVLLGGYYSRIFNLLGLFLIFAFCLKILTPPTPRFRSHPSTPKLNALDPPRQKPSSNFTDNQEESTKEESLKEENLKEDNLEDDMFDVMSLRKLVKMERQRFNAACAEIEKERVAASSAAEETMAMILRLQSEKSAVEIQAKQFRRVVEQKQEYDLEVIESLRWTVVQLEMQKNLLEDRLGVYKEKLRQFLEDEEIDQLEEGVDSDSGFLNFSVEYDLDVSASASLQSQSPPHTHSHTQPL